MHSMYWLSQTQTQPLRRNKHCPQGRTPPQTSPSCRWRLRSTVRSPGVCSRHRSSKRAAFWRGVGWISKYPEVLYYYSQGITTECRERSDETLGNVGITTGLVSAAHRLHASLGTGLRHHPFLQPVTAHYRYYVVFVSVLFDEQIYRIMQKI